MALQGKSIAEFFCRHLVALSVLVRETGGQRRELGEVLSCFAMQVTDRWFLVTAGHFIEHLKELYACSNYEVLDCGLYDGWTPVRSRTLIPFNFADVRAYSNPCSSGTPLGRSLGSVVHSQEPLDRGPPAPRR